MKFREFRAKIKDQLFFNLNDVRKLDENFHRSQFTFWLEKGYIRSLAGEYYFLADRAVSEEDLFNAANSIYKPSYVSLESALAYYQIIPETVLGVTSVSSRKTKLFESLWGKFSYRSIKPMYMFGYKVVEYDGSHKYLMASLEKAILDYLYLNPQVSSVEDFEGLRWNKSELRLLEKNKLFENYLGIFSKHSLVARVSTLRRYLDA